ncbi:family 20 glycosylhydrolase, partial [Arthrospira platensis SPKY1]|nr:family 20 glycosylhydrolase [Arthrospira platensis SPKY1]
GYTSLKKVYGYEPVPAALEPEYHHHVLGAQANVWTEYMPVPEHVEYMVFPRLAALAEVLWSPENSRDWQGFSKRMEKQYLRYERDMLNYAKSAFQVVINALPKPGTKTLELTLTSEMYEPEIRYTTNGENPDQNSLLYQKPFTISESSTVKAAVFG